MRFLIFFVLLLAASPVLAIVGGGDVTMKSKGGTVLFSHEAHVSGAGQKCSACHDKPLRTVNSTKKLL
jgi:hypothetical protein